MSPVKNTTNMSISLLMDSTEVITTVENAGNPGNDHTATGIPISLLWMPYVGFSLILIVLMLVSFLHYHRKHGHKYHHQQQFWGNDMSVTSIFGTLQNQVVNLGKRSQGPDGNETGRARKSSESKHADIPPRSKGIGYRGVEEYIPPPVNPPQNLPPNGGLHINRNNKLENKDLRLSHAGDSIPRRVLPSQPTTQPSNPINQRAGQRPRLRNPHCDEPSTSSSTVSSKTSNQSTKHAGVRNRPPHNRRHKRPLVFESNNNGSMVDIRVDLKDSTSTFELRPTPKDRGPPAHGDTSHLHHSSSMSAPHTSGNAPRNNPSYNTDSSAHETETYNKRKGQRPPKDYNTWEVASVETHPGNPSYRGTTRHVNPDEISLYEDRNSRSSSLPIWSTMPLCPKPAPPRRDIYSYPFTPSGHMEMLSDTENDEVFLLQHTKL